MLSDDDNDGVVMLIIVSDNYDERRDLSDYKKY